MPLTQEQVVKNTKKYFTTGQEQNFITEDFIAFLGADFMKAPASTMKDMNNAFEGGLIDHLLKTTKYAIGINSILPDELKLTKEEIIKVCFLYQIGKAHLFVPCTSEWHRNNLGKMYDFNDKLVSMRVGERSAFYAQTNGVKLTETEYSAIVNHDKPDDDLQAKFHNSMLGDVLKIANILATKEEKLSV